MFDLSDGGSVERPLQTSLVHIPAANLAEFLRIEQTGTVGGESKID